MLPATLETEEAQFIQRERKMRVDGGPQGLMAGK